MNRRKIYLVPGGRQSVQKWAVFVINKGIRVYARGKNMTQIKRNIKLILKIKITEMNFLSSIGYNHRKYSSAVLIFKKDSNLHW